MHIIAITVNLKIESNYGSKVRLFCIDLIHLSGPHDPWLEKADSGDWKESHKK